jgi:hypothetical protein
VTLESFSVPKSWVPEAAEGECVAPERFALRIAAAPYSGSLTGPANGSVEARVVDAGEGTPEAFAKLGAAARGAIALVGSREMKTLDDLFAEYMKSGPMVKRRGRRGWRRYRCNRRGRTGCSTGIRWRSRMKPSRCRQR